MSPTATKLAPAREIKDFEFRRRGNYPWDLWTSGRKFEIERGKQFPADIDVENFRSQLYGQASDMGLKVRTSVDGDVLKFQFYGHKTKGKASPKPNLKDVAAKPRSSPTTKTSKADSKSSPQTSPKVKSKPRKSDRTKPDKSKRPTTKAKALKPRTTSPKYKDANRGISQAGSNGSPPEAAQAT